MRNSPDESDASSTPRDWMLGHIDAPQRTWPYYPVPSVARATGVPRDSPAVDDRFRWGARYVRLLGTVRTLYTNTEPLSTPCRLCQVRDSQPETPHDGEGTATDRLQLAARDALCASCHRRF